MEISADTSIILNIWTLLACAFFLWRLSANISKFKEHTENELRDHNERLREIESLELKAMLTEIQTNLKRIMKKMEEIWK
jgi:cytochrome c-type biogenesis protein CcmH/NrfG